MSDNVSVVLSNGDNVVIWATPHNEKINNIGYPNKRADLFELWIEFLPVSPGTTITVTGFYQVGGVGSAMGEIVGEQVDTIMGTMSETGRCQKRPRVLVGRPTAYLMPVDAQFQKMMDTTPVLTAEQISHRVYFKIKSMDINGNETIEVVTSDLVLELEQQQQEGPADGAGMGN